ncbi:MAG: hypothetical protein NTY74_07440 [Ignavibacteriae bacterium]|nr:hypothetical protein [Ignavibacteriota bacterium]
MVAHKIFFNVIYFREHLKKFKNDIEKLEYLKYVKNEYTDLYYHYNDAELGIYLKEHKMDDKVEINYMVNLFTNNVNRVESSRYSSFLKNIGNYLLPFVEKEINNLIADLNEPLRIRELKKTEDLISPDDAKPALKADSDAFCILKFRWQKENVLLPYLFEVLLDEGFISHSDYENRHDFIEQSFLKKNGKPFPSKESDQSELNYRSNSKNNKKPRNAFKVDRVAEKLKAKAKRPK